MRGQNRKLYHFILAGLVACSLAIVPGAKAAPPAGSSEEVHELLEQVELVAMDLQHDADQLARWTDNRMVTWQSHAERLNLIRGHINRAGELLSRLHNAREKASPWQQEATDRITPLLKELADNTETMIKHLNDNQKKIHFAPYTDYARAHYDLAKGLATLISDFVAYGEHEQAYRDLREKLMPSAT